MLEMWEDNEMSAARKLPLPPSHPQVCYRDEQWEGSPVVPFPATVNQPAIARLAIKIVRSGKIEAGIETAITDRGRRLFIAQVPKSIADIELTFYEADLREMVRLAAERLAND